MKNQIFYCVLFVLWGFCAYTGKAQNIFPFQNPDLSFEKRVDDLVSRLTLEEKISQMLNNLLFCDILKDTIERRKEDGKH